MGKIIMIGSMKGGVSKTVTTYNLAYSLQKLGKKGFWLSILTARQICPPALGLRIRLQFLLLLAI